MKIHEKEAEDGPFFLKKRPIGPDLDLQLLLFVLLLDLLVVEQQRDDLLRLQVPALALEASALDHHLLNGRLLLRPLQDPLLDGALAD